MTTVRTTRPAARRVAVAAPATEDLHDDLVGLVNPAQVAGAAVAEGPVADVVDVTDGEAPPGDRLLRLQKRRRLVREEILALVFLLLMLAITVGVLAMQWLGGGGVTSVSVQASSVTSILSGGPA